MEFDQLGRLFNMNPAVQAQARPFIEQAAQRGQLDIEKSQLENLFNQQNNPHRVQRSALENQSLEAQIPGMRANSQSLGMKADREAATQNEAIEAARKKFIAEATEDDIKQLESHARGMAMSPDPSVRAKGELLLGQTKEMLGERLKASEMATRQQELEGLRGKNQRDLMQMQIDAGRFNKANRGAQDALEKALVSGSWDKAATAYDAMAQRAQESGDSETALFYQTKAKEYADKYVQSRAGGFAPTGKPDLKQMGGLPTNPQPTTQTPSLPGQQTQPTSIPKMTMGQLQQMYPGVPPEKLKEAFKKKFNVDVQ